MDAPTTTRCCSALALIIAWVHLIGASPAQFPLGSPPPSMPMLPGDRPGAKALPLSPFPARTHYTLALNNPLLAPAAFNEGFGYFPIAGDRIVAYDLTSGSQQWLVSAAPLMAPVVGDGLLFINQQEKLTALKTSDGASAWEIAFTETIAAPLFWTEGWLIVATPTQLQAFRAKDGSRVWQQPIAGVRAALASSGKQLYASLGDKRVIALHLDTGVTVWERRLAGEPNEMVATPDRLFVGSNDNFLYSLKTEDGIVDWHSPRTGADIVRRPIVDRDRVYFVSLDNVLRALNRSNGVQLWKKALPFRPVWPPVAAADTIVVAGITGALRAFASKDGAPAGELPTDAAGELAIAPYAFASPTALGPIVIVVTKSITGVATVTAVSHAIEPPTVPLGPLPGVIPVVVPKT